MSKPVFRVFGLENSSRADEYPESQTRTQPTTIRLAGTSVVESLVAETVTVRIRDVIPALREAVGSGSTWVKDFQDDPIVISRDLHEVLIAFQRMRRAA